MVGSPGVRVVQGTCAVRVKHQATLLQNRSRPNFSAALSWPFFHVMLIKKVVRIPTSIYVVIFCEFILKQLVVVLLKVSSSNIASCEAFFCEFL